MFKQTFITVSTILVTLFVTNLFVWSSERKELPSVPCALLGKWEDYNEETTLKINQNTIITKQDNKVYRCKVEQVIIYKDGFLFSGLFGNQKASITCDYESTLKDQKPEESFGISTPKNYRKEYRLTMPNAEQEIIVHHTKFMSKGYSESEGTYEWLLGYFFKI